MAIVASKLPEYDKIRQQTGQRFQSQGQQQTDALQRKFASLGNLKSGAAIKQEQLIQGDLNEQKEAALGQVDVQEAGEVQRRQEVQDARDFASAETLKGREFASAEALKGREFEGSQAQIGRDFSSAEALKGREFAGQESALGRAMQKSQFDESFGEQKRQNEKMNSMARKEFDFNKKATQANQAQSLAQLKPEQYRAYLDNLFDINQEALSGAQRDSVKARRAITIVRR